MMEFKSTMVIMELTGIYMVMWESKSSNCDIGMQGLLTHHD